MNKLYHDQKISTYKIQKDLNLSKYTLYRYCNGQRKIENMPTKLLLDLAYYLHMSPNTLFDKIKWYQTKKEIERKERQWDA